MGISFLRGQGSMILTVRREEYNSCLHILKLPIAPIIRLQNEEYPFPTGPRRGQFCEDSSHAASIGDPFKGHHGAKSSPYHCRRTPTGM